MNNFKNYLDENLNGSEGANLDSDIVQFILESFNLATQTHIYHLVTKSHAEHLAIDDFYEGLRECIDSVAETAIGLDIDIGDHNFANTLVFSYDKFELLSRIQQYRIKVSGLIDRTNQSSLMSINDKFISIQKLIDTLLYKLQLS